MLHPDVITAPASVEIEEVTAVVDSVVVAVAAVVRGVW
jgi:hypothetical protein